MFQKQLLSQVFLVNEFYCKKIVSYVKKDKNIVEIGCGLGALTKYFNNKNILLIEKDYRFKNKVISIISKNNNYEFVCDDILKIDLKQKIENFFGDKKIVIISNLPYSIATKIITLCIKLQNVQKLIFMVQKEYGLNLLNNKNTLSIYCQIFSRINQLFIVKKENFKPIPKVDSIVLEFNISPLSYIKNIGEFMCFVKLCFENKRKQLLNNLSNKINKNKNELKIIFEKNNIKLSTRIEELTIKEIYCLYENIKNNDKNN